MGTMRSKMGVVHMSEPLPCLLTVRCQMSDVNGAGGWMWRNAQKEFRISCAIALLAVSDIRHIRSVPAITSILTATFEAFGDWLTLAEQADQRSSRGQQAMPNRMSTLGVIVFYMAQPQAPRVEKIPAAGEGEKMYGLPAHPAAWRRAACRRGR